MKSRGTRPRYYNEPVRYLLEELMMRCRSPHTRHGQPVHASDFLWYSFKCQLGLMHQMHKPICDLIRRNDAFIF